MGAEGLEDVPQKLEEVRIKEMIRIAIGQLAYSYTPYSGFKVGASLLTKDGRLYTGCKAVSEGEREFRAICIVGGKDGVLTEYTAPCGVCRQVMMEFCNPDIFQIILATSEEQYEIFTLRQLLPLGFGPANLA